MLQLLRSLWSEELGQDLIEYTLMITFVVIVTAGVFSHRRHLDQGDREHEQRPRSTPPTKSPPAVNLAVGRRQRTSANPRFM